MFNSNCADLFCGPEGKKINNPLYMEIDFKLYKFKELDKNDLLVYGALKTLLGNKKIGIYKNINSKIAQILMMGESTVRKSLEYLAVANLIKIIWIQRGKTAIKLTDAFRRLPYLYSIPVYYRMFAYPNITKTMIFVYTYYWGLKNDPSLRKEGKTEHEQVSEVLGISKDRLFKILREMEKIGLVDLVKKRGRLSVLLKIDFEKSKSGECFYNEHVKWIFSTCTDFAELNTAC